MSADAVYLAPDATLPYCRGCGHALVVRHLSQALEHLRIAPRSVVLTTDIGCVGLADSLFPYLHTVHTTHGRSTAMATGMALAEALHESSALKPIVMIGDGGAMIGLLHLVHAAQLNVDITVLVHNNFLFGMTGGQHSALTPLDFVTSTTRDGNWTPPLDLLALLRSAHAGFLARQLATGPELSTVIADAIDYPGFSLVEIVELCTAYATRMNDLNGKALAEILEKQHYWMGEQEVEQERPTFRDLYRHQLKPPNPAASAAEVAHKEIRAPLDRELRIVVAGSAGERVQSAASLLCRAALAAGLFSTQKNDNPVTQGTGFSLAEVVLSPQPVEYTGMESPDVVLAVSPEGWNELRSNGTLERCRPETLLVLDAALDAASIKGRVLPLPLRSQATPKRAALAAIAAWLDQAAVLPQATWDAALASLAAERRDEAWAALRAGREIAADGEASAS